MLTLKKIYKTHKEVIGYLFFGVLTTLVNMSVFYTLDTVPTIHYLFANAIAIIVSIIFAFFTNKKYVFKSETSTLYAWLKEFFLFCSFRLISAGFDMFSMLVLIGFFEWDSNLAKLITQVIIISLNYFFSKWLIFKK
ncbi:Putative flippase GtrA (transmembrane translocase of bactoprenol-linked glucose) [Carnobacterium iners]|uniref:Putative flippase GtrA (Transmembrane translocase of bactoprenol-linked glucose) n=2 Tax=Carnobacterium iners TaxID=1073423 RepID=A0A1X7N3R0_9LACT|nr:Putative flippase GtrA (transmembrane translocase of bactoprenol-linked glucose) [Carnobacterium iners]SMH32019.1 Putative flippase GtrA (transmembrane translocase of bactoprenol-linked glucose) [Carnobacterium iners]